MMHRFHIYRLLGRLYLFATRFSPTCINMFGFPWELNLAKFSRIFAKSSNFSLEYTGIATLKSENGSFSLRILWDFSKLSWHSSIVRVNASGFNHLCTSRAVFIFPFDFARQTCTLHLEENENLVLNQSNALLWASHSCGFCVKSLKILDNAMLREVKGKANYMVCQSSKERELCLVQQISFPRRALQASYNSLGSNSTTIDDGSSYSFPSNTTSSNGGHRNKKALAMEIVFPVAAFLLLVFCLALVFTKRRKPKRNQINTAISLKSRRQEDEDLLETLAPGLPPRFTYAEMEEATNGFQKKLGEGGYGAVYEGMLPSSGSKIAVKVFLDTASTACRRGFCAEVMSIGEKKHSNLVQLCGFCVEDDHRMLVYELMENGSLNKVLFGGAKAEKSKGALLSWERRKAIAKDTARALAFLHEEGEKKTPVVHCDVKPENILLNERWEAKVSDFGLAKLLWAAKGGGHHGSEEEEGEEDGKANGKQTPSEEPSRTTRGLISSRGVRGTLGYLAPEWLRVDAGPDTITTASDVYSFGIVLLELIAGRRSMVPGLPFLPGLAFDSLADGRHLSHLLDPLLLTHGAHLGNPTSFELEDVQKYVNVALWCLQEDLTLRPTMVDVLNMLTNKEPVQSPPFCDYFAGSSHFFDEGEYNHHSHIFSDNSSKSHDQGLESSTNTSHETGSWQISIISGR